MIKIELFKFVSSRYQRAVLLLTILIYPSIGIALTYMQQQEGTMTDPELFEKAAYSMIVFAQGYFFMPVWILFFVAREFENFHVHQVVFARGRTFYFKSKIFYCFALSCLFTILGIASALLCMTFLKLDNEIPISFFLLWIPQQLLSHFCFSVLLLSLTFFIRSQGFAFTAYLCYSVIEGLAYTILNGLYDIKLTWLPLHLIKLISSYDGSASSASLYNPLGDNPIEVAGPIVFTGLLLFLTHRYFVWKDLKPLSD